MWKLSSVQLVFLNNNHIYVTFCVVRFFQSVKEAKNFEVGILIVNFEHTKGNACKLVIFFFAQDGDDTLTL